MQHKRNVIGSKHFTVESCFALSNFIGLLRSVFGSKIRLTRPKVQEQKCKMFVKSDCRKVNFPSKTNFELRVRIWSTDP